MSAIFGSSGGAGEGALPFGLRGQVRTQQGTEGKQRKRHTQLWHITPQIICTAVPDAACRSTQQEWRPGAEVFLGPESTAGSKCTDVQTFLFPRAWVAPAHRLSQWKK